MQDVINVPAEMKRYKKVFCDKIKNDIARGFFVEGINEIYGYERRGLNVVKEADIESWGRLYEVATQIKELNSWEYFGDKKIIYLADEEAYVCLLKHEDNTYNIWVYEGEMGFDRYKLYISSEYLDVSSDMAMYLQNALTCYWGERDDLSRRQYNIVRKLGYNFRGKNKWLYFISCETDYMPSNLDYYEVERMIKYLTGLKNALDMYISDMPEIDFEHGELLCYSSGKKKIFSKTTDYRDFRFMGIEATYKTELVEHLKSLPKLLGVLEVDLIPTFSARNKPEYKKSSNPALCMIVDEKNGNLIALEPTTPVNGVFNEFVHIVTEFFFKHGMPEHIKVSNSITEYVLDELCDTLGIRLERVDCLPGIEKARKSIRRFWL